MYPVTGITDNWKPEIEHICKRYWGSSFVVSRGRKFEVSALPGFVALNEARQIAGFMTYHIENRQLEIVSIVSLFENQGIGTTLIDQAIETAKQHQCHRVWLVSTNDNWKALRFYQKRGFNLCQLHRNAVEASRKLKPEIPFTGLDDIPILHELELEMNLAVSTTPSK